MAAPPVEDLGAYNPFTKTVAFNKERALYWITMGAQPTTTVHNLLVDQKIISVKKFAVKMKKAAPAAVVAEVPKAAVAEAPIAPTIEPEATEPATA